MTWKGCRVGNHLPWIKFHGRDAIEDPKARIHQLTRAQRWTWLETLWHLANCRHPETGERGHGYDSNGEVISDAKWRAIVSVSDSVWIRFVFDSVDKLRLFGRHSDGALYLTNPHKVVPAKDNTTAERMRRHRRYAVTPVTVTPEEPEPEPEPEPEHIRAAVTPAVSGRARNPVAIQLAGMFVSLQRPRKETRERVAEQFEVLLDQASVTADQLNAEVTRGDRRKDEASWHLADRMAPHGRGESGDAKMKRILAKGTKR